MYYVIGLLLIAATLGVQYATRKVENSFLTRLISGTILVLVALEVIIFGRFVLFFTTLVLGLVGTFELYRALGIHSEDGKRINALEGAGYLSVILFYLVAAPERSSLQLPVLIFDMIMILFIYVFTYPKYDYKQVMETYFGVIYVGVMLSFVYQTRMLTGGEYIVWLIFVCSWGCDTCAYCAGRLFGKRKLAPVLSPKKTVEGAIGGVAGAALIGLIFALATHGPALEYVIISAVGALISMVGDLAASAIKRNAGIKDYGTLIPGHGGILDRFDSVIFTAPIIYFLATILIS